MNKRQVVVLWIIAILLIVAAIVVRMGDRDGTVTKMQRADGETFLKEFPADQVAKIELKGAKDTTTLVRKDGKWSVAERENYPAKLSSVQEFLRTLTEVKVTQGIECEPSFLPRFGMDAAASKEEDRGIQAVFTNDAGSEVAKVNFGKNVQAAGDPMSMMGGGTSGRFVSNAADTSGVYKISEIFPALTTEPKTWLDPQFIQIEKIKSISLSPPIKPEEVAWKLVRADENAEFTLEGAKEGEAVDPAATAPLKSLFSFARFDDVVSADEAAEIRNHVEARTVKIETLEGFTYTITLAPTFPKKEEPGAPAEAPVPEESFLMTVEVSAEIPAERKKEDKETPEDAKAKDTAFTERKTTLEKRLATEKALAGRTFKVAATTVQPLIKERADLIAKPDAPAAGNPGPGGAMPPGGPTLIPQQPRRPVEAVTPPIAIPPLEEGEGQ
ncbi:DUF4340 domain-containing protein [Luteolibacter sp. GHJ8]|uniref:DUF4340 domain-containing protein n=1 Tax=Luteolibacter rhizosphaerae TaxID=2989719 RepID=A0ABT3G1S3_9BACT|nr:DUF4340 domain-containing protein [Luteolibacter rhizosphaerae]MCW1913770.1 DUF4340 domain-containing protein [Luteolibacter rhizosphaerae]